MYIVTTEKTKRRLNVKCFIGVVRGGEGLLFSNETMLKYPGLLSSRNVMSDYSGEVMAEVLAERALVRPQIIPLVPVTNQYRHQDHMDLKDYKSKVSLASIKKYLLSFILTLKRGIQK